MSSLSPLPSETRRGFLARSLSVAVTAAPAFVSARALGLERAAAASERLSLGVIGIGPRCTYVLKEMLKMADVQCVAIADVQASRRDAGKQLVDTHYGNSDCTLFEDFRELLARPDIDCVLIATGDRWHGLASIMAAEAGKDIYCEKPCGLTIGICQQVAETMRRTGRVYQAGTQRRSVANFAKAVEFARTGKLGRLTDLHASVYVPVLGNDWLPSEPTPPRSECDWNMWLGPAPWRPFNRQYVAGKWRGYFDFDSGARLLDWGTHTVDLCQWANSADGTAPVEYEPRADSIACRYANGTRVILDFVEHPFGDRGPKFNTKLGVCPVTFVGEEGRISTGDDGLFDVQPAALEKEVPEAVKRVRGIDAATHARNFFDCVKTRERPICNADVMRWSHVASHAAALSWILGRTLTFDPATESFTTPTGPDVEANALRTRPARTTWDA